MVAIVNHREADVGTFGTGPFSSDAAMDLVQELAEQPAHERSEALERILSQPRDHPDMLWRTYFPDQIVAAAAVVAANLPGGEDIQHELAELIDDVEAVILPAPTSDLMDLALHGVLFAAGPNGPWHNGWANPDTAAQAQRTSDQLLTVLGQPSKDHEVRLAY